MMTLITAAKETKQLKDSYPNGAEIDTRLVRDWCE